MAAVIRLTARAWLLATAGLLAAAAGMSSLIAGNSVISVTRMTVAAGVLAAYAAALGIVTTDRAERTRTRCLIWGATVPTLVAVVNALLVLSAAGAAEAFLSALPWLVGGFVVSAFGPSLPVLRWPSWLRRRRDASPTPDRRY